MKKGLLIMLVTGIFFSACKKSDSQVIPVQNDSNYDSQNRLFRVKASSTSAFSLTITEGNASSGTSINIVQASQTSGFDYGFTPVIGDVIKVTIKSDNGTISSDIMYKGVDLDPVKVVTSGGGSSAQFTYTVNN
jgi:hypothetical protein